MTWLFNRPADFAKEMVSGFVAANATLVRQVTGGVVRNTHSKPNTVAIVIGGGSGHYPAFAGLVGQGLAHGAAMGNMFASPSAQQICSVARAANNGAGVLLVFGNYAGDVLHFGLARERLRAEGIPCETLAITDDVASAGPEESHKRRGVAGGLAVIKIAAAAAERGDSLTQVLALAEEANSRTRTVGVSFAGCTMPGAEQPLFSLPGGQLGFGMGIHGEPGITEFPVPSAEDMAKMMLGAILESRPTQDDAGVGVIVNGLGSVKYEELFVFWHSLQPLLDQQQLAIHDVIVGEFVTSLDMAGLSVTLVWFDEELEGLWKAPAWAPAFRVGTSEASLPLAAEVLQEKAQVQIPRGSEVSCHVAGQAMASLEALVQVILLNEEKLGALDAIAGDGDHGIGMARGASAAYESACNAWSRGAGAGTVLQFAADAWADKAGGTSGAIWGVILNTIGTALGNTERPDSHRMAQAVASATEAVMHFGKAKPGDKTLVDVLLPFSESLNGEVSRGKSFVEAWGIASLVAQQHADQTAELVPKVGRARPLAERSLGTPDPGAVSLAMIVRSVHENWISRQ
ncbi:dihydroxyacetone kinase family protein [Dryocola clanedunensis]|uniref:dihydroxyacetone kinase family protein n=1 Tax=Cedecea sulfonylureivorans TaxID=3051154 RepID=UPI001928F736|nr:dihydroxyacetone kinase family protein [Cedecea sulfonylureivorans]